MFSCEILHATAAPNRHELHKPKEGRAPLSGPDPTHDPCTAAPTKTTSKKGAGVFLKKKEEEEEGGRRRGG
jgi:hypothetical protein